MPDYAKELNSAQYQAATAPDNHTLVIAGAGTGKTRAIVYRLAWLLENGVAPREILLLSFTRKAAREMLNRAAALAGISLDGLTGGTFHSFAFQALRVCRPAWLEGRAFTLMDAADAGQAVKACRDTALAGRKDASFPKTQTIVGLISKSRNKELPVSEILRQDAFHLLPHAEALERIAKAYGELKQGRALLDYDDLLFELEDLLRHDARGAAALRGRFRHILVDEYQDTNLVQARIVRLLAQPASEGGRGACVMAVGDEAQSIYAFRGANVRNILDFPSQFPGCQLVRLERNYRSTQPILDVANGILANAAESFRKKLFTHKRDDALPGLIRPLTDVSEAELVAARVAELLRIHKPCEIAVLFRAGFHSYPLENALRKANIPFRKYGGLRFMEAAHIKDLLSFARLAINPLDFAAFERIAAMHKGIGPKTAARLHAALVSKDGDACARAFRRYGALMADLEFVRKLAAGAPAAGEFMRRLQDYYRPRLEELYPDDWPSRLQGLEEMLHMSDQYQDLDVFIADLALEAPDSERDAAAEDCVTLSTVHSAKGLEWNAVIILDAVEDRFPSRHALARPEEFEEERRLFYVACTRARQSLDIYAPAALYAQGGGIRVQESPFLKELPKSLFEERHENYGGQIFTVDRDVADAVEAGSSGASGASRSGLFARAARGGLGKCQSGYCRHRIFGRGKIVERLDEERVRVNFPGFGLKVILSDYLLPEE